VFELIEVAGEETGDSILPRLHRCASHTLSLTAKTDSLKTAPSTVYTKAFHSSMAKCSALWNKSSHPKSAEIIHTIAGITLKVPNATRWNSTFDAISLLLKLKPKLEEICTSLSLPPFKRAELEFLEEYVAALTPVTVALDILQGDRGGDNQPTKPGRTFFGTLAPSILSTLSGLKDLKPNVVKPLVAALIAGL